MIETVYILGAPATGKTTLVKHITQSWVHMMDGKTPLAYRVFKDLRNKEKEYNIVLGKDAPVYGGTDTLNYTAINSCDDLYKRFLKKSVKYVLAEGDRLATASFFELAKKYGNLHVIYLDLDEEIRIKRNQNRASLNKLSPQNITWQKGRLTKHKNLADKYNAQVINCGVIEYGLYIEKDVEDLAIQLKEFLV